MTNRAWIPGPPAHSELWPQGPVAEPLDRESSAVILSALGMRGELRQLSLRSDFPRGYYRLAAADGRLLFLKVIDNSVLSRHLEADTLAQWVGRCGVATSTMLPDFPKAMSPGFQILGYEFIRARYGRSDARDLEQFAGTLALLHRALRDAQAAVRVQVASAARQEILERWREQAVAGRHLPGPDSDAVAAALVRTPRDFNLDAQEQILHGDLNRGNLLFDYNNKRNIILDFETALTTWGPPALDVAMVLQRFIFARVQDPIRVRELSVKFLQKYAEWSGKNAIPDGDNLARCLDWISGRSLALLCEMVSRGEAVAKSEWDKHLWLGGLTRAQMQLLRSMFTVGDA
jgi:hypothetical protein